MPNALWPCLAGVSASVVLLSAPQAPTFRSGVDVIAVDVQVVDKDGAPVSALGASQFQVSIDGKPRKVVSADFIRADTPTTAPHAIPTADIGTGSAGMAPVPGDERVYILAFDTMSFHPLDIVPAREAARAFVQRLQPNDRVGLFAFPHGPIVEVATDRARFLSELDRLVGDASPAALNPFLPSEMIDLTTCTPPEPHALLQALLEEMTLSASVRPLG